MRVSFQHEEGLSGRAGNRVYFQVNGKTFVKAASGSYNKIPTSKQAAARLRFIEAQAYAKSIIADPLLKALYTARAGKRCSAFSLAISDFMMNRI